jgi:hypothetical protein
VAAYPGHQHGKPLLPCLPSFLTAFARARTATPAGTACTIPMGIYEPRASWPSPGAIRPHPVVHGLSMQAGLGVELRVVGCIPCSSVVRPAMCGLLSMSSAR